MESFTRYERYICLDITAEIEQQISKIFYKLYSIKINRNVLTIIMFKLFLTLQTVSKTYYNNKSIVSGIRAHAFIHNSTVKTTSVYLITRGSSILIARVNMT